MGTAKGLGKMNAEWLPLLQYSSKYGVSLSTLRRRIKANTIEFKLEHGKYIILDQPAAPTPVTHSLPVQAKTQGPAPTSVTTAKVMEAAEISHSNFVEASVLTSANRLVEEIKAAYAKILQEKEEQISQLKEEIVDLRMLVRILEENSNKASFAASKTSSADLSAPDEAFLFTDFSGTDL